MVLEVQIHPSLGNHQCKTWIKRIIHQTSQQYPKERHNAPAHQSTWHSASKSQH